MPDVLLEHYKKYPLMETKDFVKLLFQRHFGPGHLIRDEQESLKRIEAEGRGTGECESLGGAYARLPLGHLSDELTNKLFLASAGDPGEADKTAFQTDLRKLRTLITEQQIPGDLAWLEQYEAEGYPQPRHSDQYRNAYKPAYRVILSKFLPLIDLIKAIDERLPCILAIDGRAGSGKSTLARELAGLWPSSVIYMDDFFLPPDMRTPERLAEPGGNVDYARFEAEVVDHVGSAFSYRIFDCGIMDFKGGREISRAPLTIIEGSYSLSPRFGRYYDLSVFVDVDPATQLARLTARNPELVQTFADLWVPLEEQYFAAFDIEAAADFVIRL